MVTLRIILIQSRGDSRRAAGANSEAEAASLDADMHSDLAQPGVGKVHLTLELTRQLLGVSCGLDEIIRPVLQGDNKQLNELLTPCAHVHGSLAISRLRMRATELGN